MCMKWALVHADVLSCRWMKLFVCSSLQLSTCLKRVGRESSWLQSGRHCPDIILYTTFFTAITLLFIVCKQLYMFSDSLLFYSLLVSFSWFHLKTRKEIAVLRVDYPYILCIYSWLFLVTQPRKAPIRASFLNSLFFHFFLNFLNFEVRVKGRDQCNQITSSVVILSSCFSGVA